MYIQFADSFGIRYSLSCFLRKGDWFLNKKVLEIENVGYAKEEGLSACLLNKVSCTKYSTIVASSIAIYDERLGWVGLDIKHTTI